MEFTCGEWVWRGLGFANPNHAAAFLCAVLPFCWGWMRHRWLGRAFLLRNYRPDLAKWQATDPFGYPDGWNQLAYGINNPLSGVDFMGAAWTTEAMYQYYLKGNGNALTLEQMGLKNAVWDTLNKPYKSDWDDGGEWWRKVYLPCAEGSGNNPTGFMDRMKDQIRARGVSIIDRSVPVGSLPFSYNISNGYNFAPIVWAMGGGSIYVTCSDYSVSWHTSSDGFIYYTISGTYNLHYRDDFSDPIDIPNFEWGTPYSYYDSWLNNSIFLEGRIAE